jgi:dienelactone hydrolase
MQTGSKPNRTASRVSAPLRLLLVGLVGLGCTGLNLFTPQQSHAQGTTCDEPEVVKGVLTTLDGVSIATYAQGQGSTAIVLVHQVNQDHCGWSSEAKALAKKYRVMSIDLRGYGTSQRAKGTTAFAYRNDIAAAVGELRAKGAKKVVLVGASMGGSAVVVAGAFVNPPVDAIVAVSAPTNYKGQNAKTAAPKLAIPARFLAASDDGSAVTSAKSLDRSATRAPDHEAVVFATGGHGWALLRPGSPAETALTAFIDNL